MNQNDKEVQAAIKRLNQDASREKAGANIVEEASCEYCDHLFAMQPQDFSRANVHGLKKVCHRADCRRKHTKASRTSFAETRRQVRILNKK